VKGNGLVIVGEKQQLQKRALGRGLSALIPQAATPPPSAPGTAAAEASKGVLKLPIEAIERDAEQPRKQFDEDRLRELSESIRAQGVIQPILVRKEGNGYRLIAGERRWRAAQLAGLKEIPALVKDVSEAEAFELALVENLQRADLNPIEEAQGYRRLIDEFGLTQEQVSQRVSKDRSSISNALRLLALPDEVKTLLTDGAINMGHARALLGLTSPSQILELARKVSLQRLSVRETERLVQAARNPTAVTAREDTSPPPQARQVIEEIQRLLGTKVRLKDRGGKGTVEVDFFSYQDLERLMTLFRK
jgi:ParB family transcriptional regulator, chromosome partitioning protein